MSEEECRDYLASLTVKLNYAIDTGFVWGTNNVPMRASDWKQLRLRIAEVKYQLSNYGIRA